MLLLDADLYFSKYFDANKTHRLCRNCPLPYTNDERLKEHYDKCVIGNPDHVKFKVPEREKLILKNKDLCAKKEKESNKIFEGNTYIIAADVETELVERLKKDRKRTSSKRSQ